MALSFTLHADRGQLRQILLRLQTVAQIPAIDGDGKVVGFEARLIEQLRLFTGVNRYPFSALLASRTDDTLRYPPFSADFAPDGLPDYFRRCSLRIAQQTQTARLLQQPPFRCYLVNGDSGNGQGIPGAAEGRGFFRGKQQKPAS